MPKIDTSKIDNYANMTAEEKVAALEGYEFEVDYSEVEKLKTQLSKANAEAAEWRRKYNSLLSDEERKEAERQEADAAMRAELEALRKEKAISESKARFLGLGYDEKLATETAKALAEGDMEKVFANQQIHIENIRKAERASALGDTPKPPAGKRDAAITKEQFDKMGYQERLKLFNEQPELYMKFTEG